MQYNPLQGAVAEDESKWGLGHLSYRTKWGEARLDVGAGIVALERAGHASDKDLSGGGGGGRVGVEPVRGGRQGASIGLSCRQGDEETRRRDGGFREGKGGVRGAYGSFALKI